MRDGWEQQSEETKKRSITFSFATELQLTANERKMRRSVSFSTDLTLHVG